MNRRPTAACVVVERDGGVLAVSRRGLPGALGIPGGKLEPGESAAEGAAREVQEETGLLVDPSRLTLIYTDVDGDHTVATFLAQDPGGAIVQASNEGVAMWASWPALISGPFGRYNAAVREALVATSPCHWIEALGSGSLRRAKEEGMAWRDLYLHERAALEFGWGFAPVGASRVTRGKALAEGDSPATTETCWWARALRWRAKRAGREDTFEVIHATLADGDGGTTSGLAIICTPSPRPGWLPADRALVALTVMPDGRTENPC